MTSHPLNRRRFLRGLGGAAIAAPILSSLAEQDARAAGTSAAPPKRLIGLFTHYGCITNRWFPKLSHGPLAREDYAALTTLRPMAPYAKKLLMVRGIRAMNEWSFQGTLGQKNDSHTQVCGSYFTCHPVIPNSTGSFSGPGTFDAKPTGRSLDHIAAEQVNVDGSPPLFMQIGGVTGSDANTMWVVSWDAPGRIFQGFGSPAAVFNKLTNLGTPGSAADTYKVACGKSIIDIVREDLAELQRRNLSKADKKKLADWAELTHQTSVNVRSCADNANKLGLTADSIAAVSATGSFPDLSKVAPVMMDLAVLAALCDANRVILLKMPPSWVFKNLGLTLESASLSHRIGNAGMGGTCIADAINMIAKIDGWYAEQFAYLVGRLDGFDEGNGTVLDNSATVWFQEMSDGSAHNLNNLPILQAGSCGGYFKTGWAVNVEGGKADLTQGHSEDDCQGTPPRTVANLDDSGTPPDQASMPINKYYCNLLNAVGARAGADGFPAKGGTAEITHYGKYDDTRLFGSDQPTTIKSPGEYKELRAGS